MSRSAVRRTFVVQLHLNDLERDALDRVVSSGGYRSASEALRYLIRREDDPDMGSTLTLAAQAQAPKPPGSSSGD